MIKIFKGDLITDPMFFLNKVKGRKPFAMPKFGDGDMVIISRERLHDRTKFLNVFFDPNNLEDVLLSKLMLEALTCVDKDYYICFFSQSKCSPRFHKPYYKMYVERINQKPPYLATHHMFIGKDLEYLFSFFKGFFDLVKNDKTLKINWICHELVGKNKPNYINKFFFVTTNAWHVCRERIIKEVMDYGRNAKNEFFIFSAGPISEILIYRLWKENKTNMYMDVGGAFDYLQDRMQFRRHWNKPHLKPKFEHYKKLYHQNVGK